jgi:hypothetical protein
MTTTALAPDIKNEPSTDYILTEPHCWIEVGPLQLHIQNLGDGLTVDVMPLGKADEDPIQSMYVAFPPDGSLEDEFNTIMATLEHEEVGIDQEYLDAMLRNAG